MLFPQGEGSRYVCESHVAIVGAALCGRPREGHQPLPYGC